LKKNLINIGKYLLSLALGGGLLYLALSGTDVGQVYEDVKNADWNWLLFSMAVGLFSHYIRGVRWGMQMRASGYNPSNLRLFASVMTGYLVNQAIPRGGEVARCSILIKSDKIPVTTSLGTVVVERVFDLIILLSLILLAFVMEFETLDALIQDRFSGSEGGSEGPSPLLILMGAGVLGGIVFLIFRKRILQIPVFQKLAGFVQSLIEGAISIRYMKNPVLFIFYTIVIWVCYIMMTYVAFFAIDGVKDLDTNLLYFGTIVTIIGGIGMAIPSPGGIGSYHSAVIIVFTTLAVAGAASEELGRTFAFAMHASQFIMMVVAGLAGYIYLTVAPSVDSKMDKTEEVTEEVATA